MQKHAHLTESERYHVYLMKKQQKSLTEIAKSMDRSPSTISREIKRNTGKKGYRYKQAHGLACSRHKGKNKHIKRNPRSKMPITPKLKQYWSPEQITGRLWLEKGASICAETVYRFVLQDQAIGGQLYKCLRHQRKKYRKHYGRNDYRGRIPDRVEIDDRPSVVASRGRIGDREADTVIGRAHKGAILTLAERKIRLYLCQSNAKPLMQPCMP